MGRLVSIVLVTWNSAQYLQRCLDAIRVQTHPDVELIVVDNASTDASRDAATIRNDTNRGFAAAVNQAIAAARGEFVQLVNPDCFLEPSYVATLLSAFDDARVGSATGKLLRADGDGVDSMGIRMTRSGRHLDIDDPDVHGEVFGVSGAAAMYRMEFLRDVAIDGEVFDEDFFAYREDADLAWRGRLFGWKAWCEPRAVAHHVRRVTPEVRRSLPPEINMHSVKNRFLLRMKNEGAYLALRNAPFELVRDAMVIGAALTIERSSLPALRWVWRNRARVLAKRRAIQARRKVSDRALGGWFR
ncbi:MAG TPA: glycosyltransferase family 2 protein [Thermoanaerobaculia bacterium]|nr:glycosyltransferase family 2 protein [Thermoanaerobaculia bacterium]